MHARLKRPTDHMNEKESITRVLQGSAYTPEAVKEVMPLVYGELRKLAAHFLKGERANHSLAATELVHEAYVRLIGIDQVSFNDRRHFFATAAMAMRRILVEHERKRRADKRIPAEQKVSLEDAGELKQSGSSVDLIELDRALTELSKLSERQAHVVELRYFGGLTESQVADVLEVSRPTIARDMRAARRWLHREMRG